MVGRGAFGLGVPTFFGISIDLIIRDAPDREVWTYAGILVGVAAMTAICQF